MRIYAPMLVLLALAGAALLLYEPSEHRGLSPLTHIGPGYEAPEPPRVVDCVSLRRAPRAGEMVCPLCEGDGTVFIYMGGG